MNELFQNVEWLAVIIGAVLAFLAGWLWYSPGLFGRRWATGLGLEYGQHMPFAVMGQQIMALLLVSWFVAVCIAIAMPALAALGLISFVMLHYAGEGFAGHSPAVKLINGGYWIAAVLVMLFVHLLFAAL